MDSTNSEQQVQSPKPSFVLRRKGECLVCKHEKNVDVTEKYLSNEITLREAGNLLSCHYQTFQRHVSMHVLPILEKDPSIAPELRVKVDKIRILEDMINKLYIRAQLLLDQEIEPKQETAIKSIVSELNNLIVTLARLNKELGTDSNTNVDRETALFRKAAEMVLISENPEVWKKIRAKMIELATATVA